MGVLLRESSSVPMNPSSAVFVFAREPAGEVQAAPEAVDLGETRLAQELLVPAGRDGNKDTFQGRALALDLLPAVAALALELIIAVDLRRVDLSGFAQHLFDQE